MCRGGCSGSLGYSRVPSCRQDPPAFYEVFPLRCPYCGADARILAFPAEPEPVPEFDDVDPDPDGPA